MDVQLILVPYDTARRGWRSGLGPEHLLQAGLMTHLQRQGHTVAEPLLIEDDPDKPAAEIRTAFELMRRVAQAVRTARAAARFPVILSGNCNTAVGTLSGLSPDSRAIFWFDAHGDCNTPDTTRTGFLDGTGLAIALGWCWHQLAATVPGYRPVRPELTFLLGARDLDPPEGALLAGSPVTHLPPQQLARLPEALGSAPLNQSVGYLHLDLDVFDPAAVGQANYFPVAGGLTVDQLASAIAAIRGRTPLGAVGITSYAPEYDTRQTIPHAVFAALDAALQPAG
jgi:arginase